MSLTLPTMGQRLLDPVSACPHGLSAAVRWSTAPTGDELAADIGIGISPYCRAPDYAALEGPSFATSRVGGRHSQIASRKARS
jgi:hypothetical protein